MNQNVDVIYNVGCLKVFDKHFQQKEGNYFFVTSSIQRSLYTSVCMYKYFTPDFLSTLAIELQISRLVEKENWGTDVLQNICYVIRSSRFHTLISVTVGIAMKMDQKKWHWIFYERRTIVKLYFYYQTAKCAPKVMIKVQGLMSEVCIFMSD